MNFSIAIKKRSNTEKVAGLRASGILPGVLYGPSIESVSISVPYMEFVKLYEEAGESTLIDCSLDGGEPAKVLIQEVQYDPVKYVPTHVDLRQINMDEEMHVAAELVYVGQAPAVKELGGTLVKVLDIVNIKCLPKDLVSHIDVDISKLSTFEDSIHIADLPIPSGVTVTDNPDTMVAKVSPPLTEEQIKAMEEDSKSVDDVQVEKKGKEEDAENKEESGSK